MNIKKRLAFWLPFCLLAFLYTSIEVAAQAQPVTLTMPTLSVKPADTINLPIRVKHFDKITSAQFTLRWDTAVVHFVKTNMYGVNIDDVFHFNFKNTSTGQLAFSWYDGTTKGVTLPDSSILFNLKMFVSGTQNLQTTNVAFDSIPVLIEVTNTNGVLPSKLNNGNVSINIVATTDLEQQQILEATNAYPNPFYEQAQVKLESEIVGELNVTVFNDLGQQIYNQIIKNNNIGTTFVTFKREDFPNTGFYFYRLRSENLSCGGKLILE